MDEGIESPLIDDEVVVFGEAVKGCIPTGQRAHIVKSMRASHIWRR